MTSGEPVKTNFGLEEKDYKILKDLAIDPLREHGADVWVFGSRARNDHKLFSDIDILYQFAPKNHAPSGFIYQIKTALEESRLPIKVDLVAVSELAESYREQVFRDRRPL